MPDTQKNLSGTSIRGDGRGRSLGFPTANLQLTDQLSRPPDGVYACQVSFKQSPFLHVAVMHIGPRPTFDTSATVEVYILNFPDQDLYGQEFQLSQITRLRDIKKFSSPEELIAAMREDCEQARKLFTN